MKITFKLKISLILIRLKKKKHAIEKDKNDVKKKWILNNNNVNFYYNDSTRV